MRQKKCYLVEGYMDVIGMWQSGLENTVASSGTSLTDGQIALIHRFTDNVTLIYDGDAAGVKASLRGIDLLLSHKLDIKVLLLPDGEDPDSFSQKHTPEEFRAYIAEHEEDFIAFKTRTLLDSVTSGSPSARAEAVRSIVTSIASVPDLVKRSIYIQETARVMNVSERILTVEVGKALEETNARLAAAPSAQQARGAARHRRDACDHPYPRHIRTLRDGPGRAGRRGPSAHNRRQTCQPHGHRRAQRHGVRDKIRDAHILRGRRGHVAQRGRICA